MSQVQTVRVVQNSGSGQPITVELKEGATIFDLLEKLNLTPEDHTVQLQNGSANSVFRTVDGSTRLNAADALPAQGNDVQHNVSVTPQKIQGATHLSFT